MTIASRLTSIFLAGALPVLAAAATTPARPPNIIFILADDMGYGDIGPFGQKKIHTPNLDVMARQGTRFTDFYPGAAVCAPTRCCLMTGMDTGHGRIRGNRGEADVERVPLDLTDVTVAEMLRRADYATAGMGKWGLGDKKDLGVAFKQGFDLWVGYNNQDLAEDYYPEKLWRDEKEFTIPENKNGAKGRFSNDLFTDEALTFMNEQRARPFFLYLAYTIPHAVWEVPADSLQEYAGVFPEDPKAKDPKVKTPTPRATYAAMITRLDGYVGKIMAELKKLGLDDNTIVFFASDNGPTNKAGVSRFFDSAGPLKGFKGSLDEGGIRAPMIVRWPGHVPAGRESDFPWAGWDFLPTAVDLAGLPLHTPQPVDGVSVVPALLGRGTPQRDYLYWEVPSKKGFEQAVRFGDLKAIRHRIDEPIAVYNLRADIGEQHNLAGQKPDVVARAREVFHTARTPNPNWPVPNP